MNCCRIVLAVTLLVVPVIEAQDKKPDGKPEPAAAKAPIPANLPGDAHVAQTIQLGGRPLKYTATVGSLPVKDPEGKSTGEVVFTSYIVDALNRPVTFAFNGGPGAASVYLNLGAIGPRRVAFGAEGQSPSDPATLTDNPGTWLDFTDLVFIDPIGTGSAERWSRRTRPKNYFSDPTRTSPIFRGSSTTGW